VSFEDAQGVTGEDPLGLGLRFRLDRSAQPARLLARFDPRPDHRGPPGFLHGGVAASVLDETMASLSWAIEGRPSVTAKLELRYRKGVPLDGEPVRVEAWRVKDGSRRVQKVEGRIVLADESVAVEATGLFVEVTP
jgi:acyl-coenzyme A thioesterase PaaI-like protein